MINGELRSSKFKCPAIFVDTDEERKRGLNGQKINGVMVFLYCCPSYVVYKGCDDRPIDIAFCKREGNLFRVVRKISPIYPQDIVSADGIEAVLESEDNFFYKHGIDIGNSLELLIDVRGSLRNIAELYAQRRKESEDFTNFVNKKFEEAGIDLEKGRAFLRKFVHFI